MIWVSSDFGESTYGPALAYKADTSSISTQYSHQKLSPPLSLSIAIMPKNSSKDNRIEWTDEGIIKLLNWKTI